MSSPCIVNVNGKRIFGTILKFDSTLGRYLVEFRRKKVSQWIKEEFVLTRFVQS